MAEQENTKQPQPPENMLRPPAEEQKGLVTDVVVPLAQSGVGGAVGAWVGHQVAKPKNPPEQK